MSVYKTRILTAYNVSLLNYRILTAYNVSLQNYRILTAYNVSLQNYRILTAYNVSLQWCKQNAYQSVKFITHQNIKLILILCVNILH